MKRFHLFMGHDYSGSDALGTYEDSFETLDEAVSAGEECIGKRSSYDWCEIVETQEDGSLKVVRTMPTHYVPSGAWSLRRLTGTFS